MQMRRNEDGTVSIVMDAAEQLTAQSENARTAKERMDHVAQTIAAANERYEQRVKSMMPLDIDIGPLSS